MTAPRTLRRPVLPLAPAIRGRARRPGAAVAAAAALLALGGCAVGPDPFAWPAVPVATPEGMVDASGPQPISDMAWRHGEASWGKDVLGDPLIEAVLTDAGWPDPARPVPYRIEFHGCIEGRDCKELRFEAVFAPPSGAVGGGSASPWALDAGEVAAWSAAKRIGEAHLEPDGTAVLEVNLSLQGGVTRQNLDAQFQWWRALVIAFQAALAGAGSDA